MEFAAYVILSIVSLFLSFQLQDEQVKREESKLKEFAAKAKANIATISDVYALIGKVSSLSAFLNQDQLAKLQDVLNRVYNNKAYASSESQAIIGKIRTSIIKAKNKINSLISKAEALEKNANEQAVAYSSLSDEQRSEARKPHTQQWPHWKYAEGKGWYNINAEHPIYYNDAQFAKMRDPKLKPTYEGDWDIDTIGGQIGSRIQQLTDEAEQYRKEANELGEKYVQKKS